MVASHPTASQSAVVEFTISADQFQLGELFAGVSGLRIELVDLVPIDADLVPYLWIDSDPETIRTVEERFTVDARVEEFLLVTDHAGRRLYRIDWATDLDGLFACISETGIAVDHAVGTADDWEFRVFSAEHADLTAFQHALVDHGLSVTIQRVHNPAHNPMSIDPGPAIDLTLKQREALVAAFEAGYFEIPRRTTLDELAADLGISRQAVANRLQRGFATLIETAVLTPRWE